MMVSANETYGADADGFLRRWGLLLIVLSAVALRLALTPLYANLPDGMLDEGFWMYWMDLIHQHGVLNIFRESNTDYVGYHWVLWMLDLVYAPFGTRYDPHSPGLHFLVKVPPIIFDVVLIVTVYYATRTLLAVEGRVQHQEWSWLPLVAVGAWQLWRRRPWGYVISGAALAFWTLEAATVAVDQWFGHRADPSSDVASDAVVLPFAAVALITGVVFWSFLHHVAEDPDSAAPEPPS